MIYLASDHGGYLLKEKIKKYLSKINLKYEDLGTNSLKSVSYVDFGKSLCEKVLQDPENKGILICKSGIGMSIVANRFKGIRAGLCYNPKASKLCREHNDCNVLVLKGKSFLYKKMVKNFLFTPFAGGRHLERIKSIDGDKNENE